MGRQMLATRHEEEVFCNLDVLNPMVKQAFEIDYYSWTMRVGAVEGGGRAGGRLVGHAHKTGWGGWSVVGQT